MNNSYKDIILQMLDAIDYQEDKNAYADEFIRNTFMNALGSLLSTVPPEKREEILNALKEADTPEKSNEVMAKYFTEEQRNNALQTSANQSITAWMQSMQPFLKDEHKQKLKELADKNSPPPQTA